MPKKQPRIQPYGGLFSVTLEDEAGRKVEFMVQVSQKLAMWTPNGKAKSAEWPDVFAFLATRAGGAE